jgi:hypothetical protein
MMLNGRALELNADGQLPDLPPIKKDGGGAGALVLSGTSYGFVVLELGAGAGGTCATKTSDDATALSPVSRNEKAPAAAAGDTGAVDASAAGGGAGGIATNGPVACGLALTASRCVVRGRAACWDCVAQHSAALRVAGCNDSALTSWCQYGTCAPAGAFALTKYCDISASLEARADALVNAATLQEKLSMLPATNDGVPRLGLPAFMFTECLHGLKIACGGDGEPCPSIFPAPIALAATLNDSLWSSVGDAIGVENRGLYNSGGLDQVAFPYCWAPNRDANSGGPGGPPGPFGLAIA